jgi:hypothetical protein
MSTQLARSTSATCSPIVFNLPDLSLQLTFSPSFTMEFDPKTCERKLKTRLAWYKLTLTDLAYSTGDASCFGYTTARRRWPSILVSSSCNFPGIALRTTKAKTGVIEDLQRSIANLKDGEKKADGLRLVAEVQNLRDDVVRDCVIMSVSICAELSLLAG